MPSAAKAMRSWTPSSWHQRLCPCGDGTRGSLNTPRLRKDRRRVGHRSGRYNERRSRNSLQNQLKPSRRRSPSSASSASRSPPKRLSVPAQFPINALPVENYRCEPTGMKIEGDHASVNLVARVGGCISCPVELDEGTWRPNWRNMEIIDPKQPTGRSPGKTSGEQAQATCQSNMKQLATAVLSTARLTTSACRLQIAGAMSSYCRNESTSPARLTMRVELRNELQAQPAHGEVDQRPGPSPSNRAQSPQRLG